MPLILNYILHVLDPDSPEPPTVFRRSVPSCRGLSAGEVLAFPKIKATARVLYVSPSDWDSPSNVPVHMEMRTGEPQKVAEYLLSEKWQKDSVPAST